MQLIICVAVLVVCATAAGVQNVSGDALHLAQTIPLSGVEGRIDHLVVDLAGHRLFLCALGKNTLAEPRILFFHYCGRGAALALTKAD
jgi:hypothetical protein